VSVIPNHVPWFADYVGVLENSTSTASARQKHIQACKMARVAAKPGGGEHELVRPVLSSLPTYLQIAIKPSKKFYKDLDKIRHRFLWVGNQ
jgi:hypothetical protein